MWQIIKNEWQYLSRTKLLLGISVGFVLVFLFSILLGNYQNQKQSKAYETATNHLREQWESIEAMNPHSAAHYGTYVFKPSNLLSSLDEGVNGVTGNFYKRVTFQSSPYDADMAEEIANPERLQSGTLDFSFVVLYLMPLLLLIWLYNIKGAEADAGFLPLIYTQTGSKNSWLMARVAFYGVLLLLVVLGLMFYGALLTNVFKGAGSAFGQIFFWVVSYLIGWMAVFSYILISGKSSIGNTLKMVGLWLLLAFIIPAAVHQWVSIQHPANLMTDFIDAQRDERDELFNQPDSIFQEHLNSLFPQILNSPVAQDSTKMNLAMNRSGAALTNELMKKSFHTIEESNSAKNDLIRSSYWFNPVTFFQNQLNAFSETHYRDYQNYRREIQTMIDKQVKKMVLDTWNEVKVDKEKYLKYNENLKP
jgi:ABC-2 type transport system permease protein